MIKLIVGATFLLLISTGFAQFKKLPVNKHQFVVIAHRGDHTNAPENTLAAYQNAITAGADFIEIDLRTTKDHQLVIMHDENIMHMTGSNILIKDMASDSLFAIKIREAQHPEWGIHPIPTFKEVLQLGKNNINIYLDFKAADVAQTYTAIVEAGMQNNVVVYINEPGQLKEWQTIAPNMPLMISLPDNVKNKTAMVQLLNTLAIDLLDGNYTAYNAEMVAVAKTKHIPIWADIQSKEEGAGNWNTALALGLHGLQTDHPKALIDFLLKKGIR